MSFVDANTGAVIGNQQLFLGTNDGGQSWLYEQVPMAFAGSGVLFLDASRGFAWGNLSTVGYVFRTTDGGASWNDVLRVIPPPLGSATVRSLSFADFTTGYALAWLSIHHGGRVYELFRTQDGGATWDYQGGRPLDSVYAAGNSIFGLSNNTIVRSTDSGSTWTVQFGGGVDLFALSFMDENIGMVVGANGAIVKTTDGGTWIPQVSGTTVWLNGVCGVDANIWIVVGDTGTILRTTDGSATWTPQVSGTPNNLYGISCVDSNTAWVVGAGGTIVYTTTGGELREITGNR